MSYGTDWDGTGREAAKAAQAAAAGVCLAGLLVLTMLWLAGIGAREAWAVVSARLGAGSPAEAGSVCERCGGLIGEADAGHACRPEGEP